MQHKCCVKLNRRGEPDHLKEKWKAHTGLLFVTAFFLPEECIKIWNSYQSTMARGCGNFVIWHIVVSPVLHIDEEMKREMVIEKQWKDEITERCNNDKHD
jgi:hypothetical protein